MAHPILGFGQYLGMREDDSRLSAWVEAYGVNFRIQRDGRYGFISLKQQGIELRFEKEEQPVEKGRKVPKVYQLIAIGFYSSGYERYREYPAELIEGVTFSSTREEVRSILGTPNASGGGKKVAGIFIHEWDSCQVGECTVHVRYSVRGGSILTIDLTLSRFCTG